MNDERFTLAQWRTWPEGERWELIDGVPFAMSPAREFLVAMNAVSLSLPGFVWKARG